MIDDLFPALIESDAQIVDEFLSVIARSNKIEEEDRAVHEWVVAHQYTKMIWREGRISADHIVAHLQKFDYLYDYFTISKNECEIHLRRAKEPTFASLSRR